MFSGRLAPSVGGFESFLRKNRLPKGIHNGDHIGQAETRARCRIKQCGRRTLHFDGEFVGEHPEARKRGDS